FLDRVLLKEGLPRIDMLILSNSATGFFAGGPFFSDGAGTKSGARTDGGPDEDHRRTQSSHPERAAGHKVLGRSTSSCAGRHATPTHQRFGRPHLVGAAGGLAQVSN